METVVRDLRPLLEKKKIIAVQVSKQKLRKPWKPAWNNRINGQVIDQLNRRGKWILVEMESGLCLVIHLGMTGQLRVVDSSQTREDHTHLVFSLEGDKEQLRFRDVRRFGSAVLFESQQELENFFKENKLGPEPFGLSLEYFQDKVQKSDRTLKAILLDQQVVSGVGNIYADESLFVAKLHPSLRGADTTGTKVRKLRDAIEFVLKRAVEQRGSTIRNYLGGTGLRGQYQDEFLAYGRMGQPCTVCKTPIERIRLAGRSTHFCPRCQRR